MDWLYQACCPGSRPDRYSAEPEFASFSASAISVHGPDGSPLSERNAPSRLRFIAGSMTAYRTDPSRDHQSVVRPMSAALMSPCGTIFAHVPAAPPVRET